MCVDETHSIYPGYSSDETKEYFYESSDTIFSADINIEVSAFFECFTALKFVNECSNHFSSV
jgi:hypothetical protein